MLVLVLEGLVLVLVLVLESWVLATSLVVTYVRTLTLTRRAIGR